MTEQQKEAIRFIESQLDDGYVDLGMNDQDELGVIEEAIAVLKIIDKWNSVGCTSFQVRADELKEILERQENEMEQT